MKNTFKEYYLRTDEEVQKFFEKSDIVFDTNILLFILKKDSNTSKKIIGQLKILKDRLWIPFHVGKEYHEGFFKVVEEINQASQSYVTPIQEVIKAISNHSEYENAEEFKTRLEKFQTYLVEKKITIETLLKSETVISLASVFENRVGTSIEEELEKIKKEGEERYEKEIPPGYKDRNKSNGNQYGDLIIWKEMILHAKEKKKPILFVTDEKKKDWCFKVGGKVLDACTSLRREFFEETGQEFMLCGKEKFEQNLYRYLRIGEDGELPLWIDSLPEERTEKFASTLVTNNEKAVENVSSVDKQNTSQT